VRFAVALIFACLATVACGDEGTAPPNQDPTVPAGVERVTGAERLGWDQQASDSQELAGIRYLVYVDDSAARDIQNVSCSATAGPSGFSCSGAMPTLTPGEHQLKLASFIESGGSRYESAPSPILRVFFVATGAMSTTLRTLRFPQTPSPAPEPFGTTTTDGVEIQVRVVADGLDDPTDIATTPDGAVWVAERAGVVRVFRGGRLLPAPSVTLTDAATVDGGGLLAIAADPEFPVNRFIYVVYTVEAGFRLARFRVVGDTLGDRAILLDGIPSSANPSAVLRFGPDLQLYLGLDVAGDQRTAGDLGSFNGKILRFDRDAATPRDQAGLSPVFVPNVRSPRGVDWDAAGSSLWIADDTPDATGQLQVVAMAPGASAGARGMAAVRYTLPDGAAPRGLAIYRGDLSAALRGSVLVATEEPSGEASILRIRLDAAGGGSVAGTERLLRGSIDSARAIDVSSDGVIYLCTRGALLALTPVTGQ
jgi:glucose/arabinose dehydrogenase